MTTTSLLITAGDIANRIRSIVASVRAANPLQRPAYGALARSLSTKIGKSWAFTAACAGMLVWTMLGPLFDYSPAWQQVVNAGTIIVMFSVVFLIQSAQDRDSVALRRKLHEVLIAIQAARDEFVNLDELEDEQLEALHLELCSELRTRADVSNAQ